MNATMHHIVGTSLSFKQAVYCSPHALNMPSVEAAPHVEGNTCQTCQAVSTAVSTPTLIFANSEAGAAIQCCNCQHQQARDLSSPVALHAIQCKQCTVRLLSKARRQLARRLQPQCPGWSNSCNRCTCSIASPLDAREQARSDWLVTGCKKLFRMFNTHSNTRTHCQPRDWIYAYIT
jgi:hypothetical protein